MQYTPNYNLAKPEENEAADIEMLNQNADKIDTELLEINNQLNSIPDKASSADALAGTDDVKYMTPKTTADVTASSKILTGATPPSISTEGALGQFYFDTLKKKSYKCTSINGGVYTWEGPLEYVYDGNLYRQFQQLTKFFQATNMQSFGGNRFMSITPDKTKLFYANGTTIYYVDLTQAVITGPTHSVSWATPTMLIAYNNALLLTQANTNTVAVYRVVNNQLTLVSNRIIPTTGNPISRQLGMGPMVEPSGDYYLFGFEQSASPNTKYIFKMHKTSLDISQVMTYANGYYWNFWLLWGDYIIVNHNGNGSSRFYIDAVKWDGTQVAIESKYDANGVSANTMIADEDGVLYYLWQTYSTVTTTHYRRYNLKTWTQIAYTTIADQTATQGMLALNSKLFVRGTNSICLEVDKVGLVIKSESYLSCGTALTIQADGTMKSVNPVLNADMDLHPNVSITFDFVGQCLYAQKIAFGKKMLIGGIS